MTLEELHECFMEERRAILVHRGQHVGFLGVGEREE